MIVLLILVGDVPPAETLPREGRVSVGASDESAVVEQLEDQVLCGVIFVLAESIVVLVGTNPAKVVFLTPFFASKLPKYVGVPWCWHHLNASISSWFQFPETVLAG